MEERRGGWEGRRGEERGKEARTGKDRREIEEEGTGIKSKAYPFRGYLLAHLLSVCKFSYKDVWILDLSLPHLREIRDVNHVLI